MDVGQGEPFAAARQRAAVRAPRIGRRAAAGRRARRDTRVAVSGRATLVSTTLPAIGLVHRSRACRCAPGFVDRGHRNRRGSPAPLAWGGPRVVPDASGLPGTRTGAYGTRRAASFRRVSPGRTGRLTRVDAPGRREPRSARGEPAGLRTRTRKRAAPLECHSRDGGIDARRRTAAGRRAAARDADGRGPRARGNGLHARHCPRCSNGLLDDLGALLAIPPPRREIPRFPRSSRVSPRAPLRRPQAVRLAYRRLFIAERALGTDVQLPANRRNRSLSSRGNLARAHVCACARFRIHRLDDGDGTCRQDRRSIHDR